MDFLRFIYAIETLRIAERNHLSRHIFGNLTANETFAATSPRAINHFIEMTISIINAPLHTVVDVERYCDFAAILCRFKPTIYNVMVIVRQLVEFEEDYF